MKDNIVDVQKEFGAINIEKVPVKYLTGTFRNQQSYTMLDMLWLIILNRFNGENRVIAFNEEFLAEWIEELYAGKSLPAAATELATDYLIQLIDKGHAEAYGSKGYYKILNNPFI